MVPLWVTLETTKVPMYDFHIPWSQQSKVPLIFNVKAYGRVMVHAIMWVSYSLQTCGGCSITSLFYRRGEVYFHVKSWIL